MIGSERALIDSTGWLEFLTDGEKAALFEPYFRQANRLLVPTLVIYEVYKRLLTIEGETAAEGFFAFALRSNVVVLNDMIAVKAAELSLNHQLAMADAVIYATARAYDAELVTSDPHFEGLRGVTLL